VNRFCSKLIVSLCSLLLLACTDSDNYAPVTDISRMESIPKNGMHRVAKGETLYEIAWRFGLDYRYLAVRNNIKPPYTIKQNQIITLRGRYSEQQKQNNIASQESSVKPMTAIPADFTRHEKEPNYSASGWIWPVQGEIIKPYSAANKGIDISGHMGKPIYAAGAGKVVYCGAGLRGYGNLIIIKHNSLYLSAYAHNRLTFVKEGEWVKKGQKISEMGNTGTDKTMLHFEIRRAGKPIDPLSLYPGKIA